MKVSKVTRYGAKVWANLKMDKLRKTECLCLKCRLMKNCRYANEFFMLCQAANLAIAVTRCPDYSTEEK